MLRLVWGLPSLDAAVNQCRDCPMLVLGTLNLKNFEKVRIYKEFKLSNLSKIILLTLVTRFLNISTSDYKTLRTSIYEANTLKELMQMLEEQAFETPRLSLLVDYLKMIVDEKEASEKLYNSEKVVVDIPLVEPFNTILSLFILTQLHSDNMLGKWKCIFLFSKYVQDIVDILLMFRRYDIYVVSLEYVRDYTFFDEYIGVVNIQGKLRIVRESVGRSSEIVQQGERIVAHLDFAKKLHEELGLVELEILQVLSEMNFMTLNALRDTISHNLNVSKHEVDKAILKLERRGLVQTRVLPDGRVMIYPTLLGLVKAKEKPGH